LFQRGPPKVYVRFRTAAFPEKVVSALPGVTLSSSGGLHQLVLPEEMEARARSFRNLVDALLHGRAGRLVRLTVQAAEAAALADFASPYVLVDSAALRDSFNVVVKAKDRTVSYTLARSGKILTKKETRSAVMDAYL
jgi:hypothetical protein